MRALGASHSKQPKRRPSLWRSNSVSRLRQFIRERAAGQGRGNVYAVDGLLESLPFPRGFADVLIASHALGWNLVAELAEFGRVLKESAMIIHCPRTVAGGDEEDLHTTLIHARMVLPVRLATIERHDWRAGVGEQLGRVVKSRVLTDSHELGDYELVISRPTYVFL